MTNTAALDHAIRMYASAHPSEQSYLVDVLEEAMRFLCGQGDFTIIYEQYREWR